MPPGVLLDSLSEREATLTEWQSQLQRREEIIRAAEISKEAYAASSSSSTSYLALLTCHPSLPTLQVRACAERGGGAGVARCGLESEGGGGDGRGGEVIGV